MADRCCWGFPSSFGKTEIGLSKARNGAGRTALRPGSSILGRSPKAEVTRLRVQRAKELLRETSWSLAEIAERTGFKYGEYLHPAFTQQTGVTPGTYRKPPHADGVSPH
jgi:LacI family transcriptional regulator